MKRGTIQPNVCQELHRNTAVGMFSRSSGSAQRTESFIHKSQGDGEDLTAKVRGKLGLKDEEISPAGEDLKMEFNRILS